MDERCRCQKRIAQVGIISDTMPVKKTLVQCVKCEGYFILTRQFLVQKVETEVFIGKVPMRTSVLTESFKSLTAAQARLYRR